MSSFTLKPKHKWHCRDCSFKASEEQYADRHKTMYPRHRLYKAKPPKPRLEL